MTVKVWPFKITEKRHKKQFDFCIAYLHLSLILMFLQLRVNILSDLR